MISLFRPQDDLARLVARIVWPLAAALISFSMCERAQAQDIIPPKVETTIAVGVDGADATLRVDSVDLSLGDLTLERFHTNQTAPIQLDTTMKPAAQYYMGVPENYDFGFRMSTNMDIFVMTDMIPGTKNYFTEWNGTPYNALLPLRYHTTVHLGRSGSGMYNWDGSNTITAINQDAMSGILSISGGVFIYIDKEGNTYTFNKNVTAGGNVSGSGYSQKLSNITFANGRIRNFYYTSANNLKFVSDSKGYAIIFDYGTNGAVSDACIVDLAQVYASASSTCSGQTLTTKYIYTKSGFTSSNVASASILMTGFTDVMGNTTSYAYSSSNVAAGQSGIWYGDITCITPPGYSTCKQSFTDASGGTESLSDGTSWTIAVTRDSYPLTASQNNPYQPLGANGYNFMIAFNCWNVTTTTDPNGNTSTFVLTNSSPCNYTDANGNITKYSWLGGGLTEPSKLPPSNDGSLLSQVIFPEGNMYNAYYSQSNFNAVTQEVETAKPKSGLPNRVVNYTYGAMGSAGVTYQNLAKPLSRTDPNGNQTNWTYASWGGVLTEMKPAPASGAARPLKLYTYQQLSANILNTSGSLVSTGQPIWMPATETECQTLANSNVTSCDPNAPQKVTTYLYGATGSADNLLLHGTKASSGGVTLVTCYSYDALSHNISETAPNANLTSCP